MSRHTSKIMSPKSKRVILYRGSPPTSAQMKFKSSCKNTAVAVDETGSICYLEAGKDAKRKSFTVVSSLIWDSRRFKDVIKKFPVKSGEVKYSNTNKNDCSPIFCELSAQDFTFSETHKSRRNECFHDVRSQVCTYNEMVWQVIDAVKPECAYDIIIDSPPVSAMDNLLRWYERRLEEGERIDWFEIRSSSESYLLQVHDFITGAVGDTVEGIGEKKDLYVMIEAKNA